MRAATDVAACGKGGGWGWMGLPGQKLITSAKDGGIANDGAEARGGDGRQKDDRDAALWIGAGGVRVLPVRGEGRRNEAAVRGRHWGLVERGPGRAERAGVVGCVLEEGVPGLDLT